MKASDAAAGLNFRPGIIKSLKPDALGTLHNSYKGAFSKLRSRPRAMEALIPANHARFHTSAIQRQLESPIAYPAYRPTRVLAVGETHVTDVFADTQWNNTGLFLEAGHQYKFASSGEWLDSRDPCDWAGTQNDRFSTGDVIRAVSSLFGKTESVLKKVTNNPSTDFLFTKRVEEIRWFSLVGAIANNSGSGAIVPNDGSPHPHQYVDLPGLKTKALTVTDSGYLFCFPNDVWSLYGNNHGSVKLTVTRVA